MSNKLGIKTGITVREVMSTQVITAKETDSAQRVADIMKDKSIGSIIIVDAHGKPTGIVTDRDIVTRIVAKNLLPSDVKAREIMSTPLSMIEPSMDIGAAAQMMNARRFRRLLILDKGKIAGIITDRSIFAIMPKLMELVTEKAKIGGELVKEAPLLAGYCDNCGQWSDTLMDVEGKFLCEDCRLELEEGKEQAGREAEESET